MSTSTETKAPKALTHFTVTLPWAFNGNPSDEEGTYRTCVWAVDEDSAIRAAAEEMAESGEKEFDDDEERAGYIASRVSGRTDVENTREAVSYKLSELFDAPMNLCGANIDMAKLELLMAAHRDYLSNDATEGYEPGQSEIKMGLMVTAAAAFDDLAKSHPALTAEIKAKTVDEVSDWYLGQLNNPPVPTGILVKTPGLVQRIGLAVRESALRALGQDETEKTRAAGSNIYEGWYGLVGEAFDTLAVTHPVLCEANKASIVSEVVRWYVDNQPATRLYPGAPKQGAIELMSGVMKGEALRLTVTAELDTSEAAFSRDRAS